MKELHLSCSTTSAWNIENVLEYESCTSQISLSNTRIFGNLPDIQVFAVNHDTTLPLNIQLELVTEDVEISPDLSKGLEKAIEYIKNVSSTSPHFPICAEKVGCMKNTREVVVRLKMIEWGLFGLGQATSGWFIAYHYSKIGPYFGDLDGNTWPHAPLHQDPSSLENSFDRILVNLTHIMSKGKLENVSILDLLSFGSKIPQLKKSQSKEPNWPIEANFALQRISSGNLSHTFVQYKTLLEHWSNHINKLYENDHDASFTWDMEHNNFVNFTRFINKDIKSYIIAMAGNCHTRQRVYLVIQHYFQFTLCTMNPLL